MHEDIRWFLGVIGVFAVIWFASGGVYRESSKRPFVIPLNTTGGVVETYGPVSGSQSQSGQTSQSYGGSYSSSGSTGQKSSGEIKAELERAEDEAVKLQAELKQLENTSPLQGKISLQGVTAGGIAENEYLVIRANPNNKERVKLTGVTVTSAATGATGNIGKGVYLPFVGIVNASEDIYLDPADTAYIITGRSPLGISFKINRCIGYIAQFQNFSPSLPYDCPRPIDEPLPQPPNQLNDRCLDYIASLPVCRAFPNPPTDLNTRLSRECQEHIRNEIGYNKCIGFHKNQPGFYRKEWRVYLGRSSPLWKNRREVIRLLDENNKFIQSYTY